MTTGVIIKEQAVKSIRADTTFMPAKQIIVGQRIIVGKYVANVTEINPVENNCLLFKAEFVRSRAKLVGYFSADATIEVESTDLPVNKWVGEDMHGRFTKLYG